MDFAVGEMKNQPELIFKSAPAGFLFEKFILRN